MNKFPIILGSIDEYDVIAVGHLKWNPYFGDTEDLPPRGDPSTCTSTMIRGRDMDGKPYVLVIDPTLRLGPADYYFDINRRTGLLPEDVTHCFISHEHFDHQIGVNYFPNAQWLAATEVAEVLKTSPFIDGSQITAVSGEFLPGVFAVPIPGHTMSLHGVAFMCNGLRYLVAGDGVMTKGHFINETSMFEADVKSASKSIRMMKESFDIVIPGHDNVIVNIVK